LRFALAMALSALLVTLAAIALRVPEIYARSSADGWCAFYPDPRWERLLVLPATAGVLSSALYFLVSRRARAWWWRGFVGLAVGVGAFIVLVLLMAPNFESGYCQS
jgi:hypothetical protein